MKEEKAPSDVETLADVVRRLRMHMLAKKEKTQQAPADLPQVVHDGAKGNDLRQHRMLGDDF